jgi:hypothetical protein
MIYYENSRWLSKEWCPPHHLKLIGLAMLISEELSKPIKKDIGSIECLPLHYFSELVNSEGFYGMRFISSVPPQEFLKVTLFDPEVVECRDIYSVRATNINYKTKVYTRLLIYFKTKTFKRKKVRDCKNAKHRNSLCAHQSGNARNS